MTSPADYTIIALLVAAAAGLWMVFERLGQVQRDIDALKRKLGVGEPPGPPL
jgi:hypothetical protein